MVFTALYCAINFSLLLRIFLPSSAIFFSFYPLCQYDFSTCLHVCQVWWNLFLFHSKNSNVLRTKKKENKENKREWSKKFWWDLSRRKKAHDCQCSCVYEECVYVITISSWCTLTPLEKFQAVVYLNNSHININYVIITKQQAVARIKHIIGKRMGEVFTDAFHAT